MPFFFLEIGQLSSSKGYVPAERTCMYLKEYSCEFHSLKQWVIFHMMVARLKIQTNWQNERERDGMTEWQTTVNIDSCSIQKKKQLRLSSKSFSESMIKTTLSSWQIFKSGRWVRKTLTESMQKLFLFAWYKPHVS